MALVDPSQQAGVGFAEFLIVDVRLPSRAPEPVGVLLLQEDELHVRFRRDWLYLAGQEHFAFLDALGGSLERDASRMGGSALVAMLEDSSSNFLSVSQRERVLCLEPERTLAMLYAREVKPEVLRYETHLPVYSFQAAATRFGPQREADYEPAEWREAPADLTLSEDMFAVEVIGKSMEPLIPDGALAVFRAGVTGSRHGRIVLVEYSDGGGARHTVKRYRSEKSYGSQKSYGSEKTQSVGDEGWGHTRIWLEPLNPDFEAFSLGPDDELQVIAEFVRVLS